MSNIAITQNSPGDGTVPQARTKRVPHRGAFLEMLISSALGLVASFVLSVEAINLLKHPLATASCDVSEYISCTKVGMSPQANLFGFPNSFLGLIAEPVVITVAVAALGGVRFPVEQ